MSELLPLNDPEALRRRWRQRALLRKSKRAIFDRLKQYGIHDLPRLVLGIFVACIFLLSFASAIFSIGLPNPTRLVTQKSLESTKVVDRNGVVLSGIYGSKLRNSIPLIEIPEYLREATISAEDKGFYYHKGFDVRGLIRGVILKPLLGQRAQGGSTITQQLAKNSFLTSERSIGRKIKEFILALEIERLYTKDKILEMYLNEIPYGGLIYGVQSASEAYLGKEANEISMAEAAVLSALPQSPTYYSPWGQRPDELLERKDWVLRRMFEEGYITEKELKAATDEKIVFQPRKDSIKAPHFVMYVKEMLAAEYGDKVLEEGGMTITTTLDWGLQEAAEAVITSKAEVNKTKYDASNEALVSIDPWTGEILAMVGSKDYFNLEDDGNVNVTISERQPGSSIKPIIYAAAFQKGYSPATMLMDVTTDFGNDYKPGDYDGKNRGPVSVRSALQMSLNIPAVKTLAYAGVNEAINLAHKMGITTLNEPERYGLSLVLGGGEVKLLDLTAAYGVFATGGEKAKLMSVLKVEDAKGRILEENSPAQRQKVLDPEIAYLINNVLSDDVARSPLFGSNGSLTLPGKVAAAKTGTTNLYKDGWTIGYTPDLVTGVWVGNNDGSPMNKASGSSVAAPIWNGFMRKALADKPNKEFTVPTGIRTAVVDSMSGKLPTDASPETKIEVFTSSNLPTESDNIHKKVRVVKSAPDRLPPNGFPLDLTEERIFTELHSERPNNSAWEEPVITWAKANGFNNTPNQMYDGPGGVSSEIQISAPANGSTVSGDFTTAAYVVDDSIVDKIEFYYDSTLVQTVKSKPWQINITGVILDGKSHTVRAKLFKKNGGTAESSISVMVGGSNSTAIILMQDVGVAPTYPLSLVANLTEVGKLVAIDKVEIYFDSIKKETFLPNSTGIYSTLVKTGFKGQHTASAVLIDKSGKKHNSNKIQFSIS
ncbi:penicillin-binding protein [Patescibacteria group bacterium]|nr:penicillin-binding protein [Patescibacteria group bacterium]